MCVCVCACARARVFIFTSYTGALNLGRLPFSHYVFSFPLVKIFIDFRVILDGHRSLFFKATESFYDYF